jgi:hypothetical protein
MLRGVLFQDLKCQFSVIDYDNCLPENCDRAERAYGSSLEISTNVIGNGRTDHKPLYV